MIPASDAAKQAVMSRTRYIKSKLLIYYDGKTATPYTNDDFILDCKILEEASADSDNPIGAVSANELSITLLNEDRRFTAKNVDSPLYGKLISGLKVEYFYMIELPDETWEDIPMGTYYTNEWQSDTGSSTASLICLDRISIWGQLDVPRLEVQRNIALKTAIQMVLLGVGLTSDQFVIDDSLNYILPFAWFPKAKLLAYLQALATGFGCLVFINRKNQLVFKYARKVIDPVCTITDSDIIMTVKSPQNTLNLYSSVNLKFTIMQQSDRIQLLEVKDVVIHPGENLINNLVFTKSPCIIFDSVSIIGGVTSTITNVDYDSWTISLKINNTQSSDETVILQVYGYILQAVESSVSVQRNDLVNTIGIRPLEVTSQIIQDATTATAYANQLLALVSSYETRLEIESRGNPLLELGDIVQVKDDYDKIQGLYSLHRSDYNYEGSLDAQLTVVKAGA